MHPDVAQILEAANQAPSGENCQPWRFVVRGLTIELYLIPERDTSHYGWGQRASYIANGAALENLCIAASASGYRAQVQYFPEVQNPWHVATVGLTKDMGIAADPLYAFIRTRISNRKKYKRLPLDPKDREALMKAAENGERVILRLAESKKDIANLARVGSANEEIMLSNRSLHGFFFSHVTWTKEEDDRKKIGFYIKTLELPPTTVALFKIIRHWPVMNVLRRIGFHKIAGMQNAQTYGASSAIGALLAESTEPLDCLRVGRTLERVWLTTTSIGLSFQPLTGVLFFNLKLVASEGNVFSETQQKLIRASYTSAERIFQAEDRPILFMFRIGKGAPPSAHASRFPLKDVVTVLS